MLARVEALARRPRALASPTLVVGDLVLDQATREVRRAGELIELTPKEYTVLEYLMRHAGRVMSRTLITEYAWGYHFDPGTNIVDVVINHLRKKVDAKHAQATHHHRARRRLHDQGRESDARRDDKRDGSATSATAPARSHMRTPRRAGIRDAEP